MLTRRKFMRAAGSGLLLPMLPKLAGARPFGGIATGGGGGGGYTGNISVRGNALYNVAYGQSGGSVIQLRGANMSGLENSAAQGTSNDWADGGVPDWAVYQTWKPNAVRIPLNAASWLGLTGYLTASQSVTFTATPASGSTGGTLTAAWTLASGTYPLQLNGNNTPQTSATFTNGSTAVTWPALSSAAPNANAVVVIWGASRSADPNGTYQNTVITAVRNAQAIGCYVILDLHWCAPSFTFGGVTHDLMPLGQSAMADSITAIPFWESIAGVFGTHVTPQSGINNHGVLFELFNEPYLNQAGYTLTSMQGGGTTLTADQALGAGGWSTAYVNNTQGGANFVFVADWQIAGHQQMVDAIRGTGAQNVLLFSGNQYCQQLKNIAVWIPTDSLATSQLAATWHPYPNTYNGMNPYPYTAYGPYPVVGGDNGFAAPSATDVQWAEDVMSTTGIPLVCTEDGGLGGTSATATPAEPHMAYMQSWVDMFGASYIFWQWNGTQPNGTSSVMNYGTAYASDGTTILPILGEGSTTNSWMVNHT